MLKHDSKLKLLKLQLLCVVHAPEPRRPPPPPAPPQKKERKTKPKIPHSYNLHSTFTIWKKIICGSAQ